MGFTPHGAFGMKEIGNISLISIAGSWNIECAQIYRNFISRRQQEVGSEERYVIVNAKNWLFETPEASRVIKDLHAEMSKKVDRVHGVYIVQPGLGAFQLERRAKDRFENVTFDLLRSVEDAAQWLIYHGVDYALTKTDFPEPMEAGYYKAQI